MLSVKNSSCESTTGVYVSGSPNKAMGGGRYSTGRPKLLRDHIQAEAVPLHCTKVEGIICGC